MAPSKYLVGISSRISPGNHPDSIASKMWWTIKKKIRVEVNQDERGYENIYFSDILYKADKEEQT